MRGGDICVRGEDKSERRGFWAIDVEAPFEEKMEDFPLLLLCDRSVATSGISRRQWISPEGEKKHHLIDPRTGKSAKTDVFSVTVIDTETDRAEVWAKSLCILGSNAGMQKAQEKKIAALFFKNDGTIAQSEYMKEFIWNNR